MIRLKNWLHVFVVAAFLTACGEQPATTNNDKDAAEKQEQVIEETPITVEHVLRQSIKAMNNIHSFSAGLNMVQEMQIHEGESYTSDADITMDMTQKPLALYQKMNMDVPELGKINTELYMVDNGIYFKDAMENRWFTYPDELKDDLINIQNIQMKPEEQLELLQKHIEHVTLEDKDAHFIVKVEGNSDSLLQFAQELNSIMKDDFSTEIEQMMTTAKVKQLDYTLLIEKETFLQTNMEMTMVYELNMEGEPLHIHTTTNATFDNFNEIDEIIVPDDIIESAEEFSLDFSEFEEMDGTEFEEVELDQIEEQVENGDN